MEEENEVTVLPWPSMRLKAELTKEWNQLSIELAKNLVGSMEKRIATLIGAEGDYTMY
ncbi:hypothetical protein RhiirA1_447952 [Rhizophagus irregularis]|uniref:Uncharacterized protein n=1 Tax=Rhizophagus irregularis TaxID=588596 RepID=A0A2N0SKV1_9GLOM|nr:hypothetical protein RhiirA1_463573 [Rhizophagus irregularis]PKC76193.1 hypothetical protein RhiirA1_447952 [Rhizophagus irregularis]